MKWGINAPRHRHPAQHFVDKYRKLLKQGYNKEKSFQICAEELSSLLESQRDEMRILRGAALISHGDSYLDRAQRVAELESELKMKRFARDVPKYERSMLEQQEKYG